MIHNPGKPTNAVKPFMQSDMEMKNRGDDRVRP